MYQCCVPCLMGVEGLVADELKFGGFRDVRAENGRVFFSADMPDIARANVWLRCGARVLILLGAFEAPTFDALFEGVKALPLGPLIGPEDAFPVKGHTLKSALQSVPACQSIVKKAAVDCLRAAHDVELLPETGARRQLQFIIQDDRAEIYLDTTGFSLYRRGYKLEQNEASLRETLAAAMVKLARYRGREPLIDPMCGSGTLVIEAAMAALNLAPGMHRDFDAETWGEGWHTAFAAAKAEARAQGDAKLQEQAGRPLSITGRDTDPAAIAQAVANAKRAGLDGLIDIAVGDACALEYPPKGVLLCNPPYGKRLLDIDAARALYRRWGQALGGTDALKKYIISSDEDFERHFGETAQKKRKLYNGMIKCNLFMYYSK